MSDFFNFVTVENFFWVVFVGLLVPLGLLAACLWPVLRKIDILFEGGPVFFILYSWAWMIVALLFAIKVDTHYVARPRSFSDTENIPSALVRFDAQGAVKEQLPREIGAVWASEGYTMVPREGKYIAFFLEGYGADGRTQRVTCHLDVEIWDFPALRLGALEQFPPLRFTPGTDYPRKDAALRTFLFPALSLVQEACRNAFPLADYEASGALLGQFAAQLDVLERQSHGLRFSPGILLEQDVTFLKPYPP